MNPLRPLTPRELSDLTPVQAVRVFRLILCGEAHRSGIPAAAINIPEAVDVADGGIDATVEGGPVVHPHSLIRISCEPLSDKNGGFVQTLAAQFS